ncbi:hypothetical protein [Niallia taxi]|uniref:hypothetical protein n=1 Tax=Niallia taxi TaxID=2499688 RepID=UPI003D2B5ACC
MKLSIKVIIITLLCPLLVCMRAYAYFSGGTENSLLAKTQTSALFYLTPSAGGAVNSAGSSVFQQTTKTINTTFGKKTSSSYALDLGSLSRPPELSLAIVNDNIGYTITNALKITNKSKNNIDIYISMVNSSAPNTTDTMDKWVKPIFAGTTNNTTQAGTLPGNQSCVINLMLVVGTRSGLAYTKVSTGSYSGLLKITVKSVDQTTGLDYNVPLTVKITDGALLGIY